MPTKVHQNWRQRIHPIRVPSSRFVISAFPTLPSRQRVLIGDSNLVRDHLTILAAFHAVRESSGEDAYPRMCEAAASQYQRWVQYVQPAQDRNGNGSGELKLPALGVLMCWHAHMLNPRLFDRECDGAYRSLREKPFPLNQIVRVQLLTFCLN